MKVVISKEWDDMAGEWVYNTVTLSSHQSSIGTIQDIIKDFIDPMVSFLSVSMAGVLVILALVAWFG